MVRTRVNPFVPGRGALPPYLAGREAEKKTMLRLLAYLEAGRGAPRDMVLCGPRGNGKTALLRWFQREVEVRRGRIDLLWRTPSDLPSVDALATSLVPPARFKTMLPSSLSLSIGVGRLGWELGENPGTLADLLALRCGQRPLAVLLDEAHALDTVVGQALLNASQSASGRAPFLLVLAGTPGLEMQLNAMSATFWDRAEHLAIDRLDPEAAAVALTRPLAAEKPPVAFDAAALARVVADSQSYPYFVQLYGAALWDDVTTDQRTTIDDAVVTSAGLSFERQKATYYQHRRNELERAGLLDFASGLGAAFENRASMTQAEVTRVIERVQARLANESRRTTRQVQPDANSAAIRVRDQLAAVGYVWNPPGEGDQWRPGIPSLMAHIQGVAEPGRG